MIYSCVVSDIVTILLYFILVKFQFLCCWRAEVIVSLSYSDILHTQKKKKVCFKKDICHFKKIPFWDLETNFAE